MASSNNLDAITDDIRRLFIYCDNGNGSEQEQLTRGVDAIALYPGMKAALLAEDAYVIGSRLPLIFKTPFESRSYFDDDVYGQLQTRCPYVDGKRHGQENGFDRKGQLRWQTCWHKGQRHGLSQEWDAHGLLVIQTMWEVDMKHGDEKRWIAGQLACVTPYNAGSKHGTAYYYDPWDGESTLKGTRKWEHGTAIGEYPDYIETGFFIQSS
jgi:hypothetical protein